MTTRITRARSILPAISAPPRGVATGIPIDSVGMTVFTAFEDDKFYVFTHPEAIEMQKVRVQAIYDGTHPIG